MEILEKNGIFWQFLRKKMQFSRNFGENIYFYPENRGNSRKSRKLQQKSRPRIPRVTAPEEELIKYQSYVLNQTLLDWFYGCLDVFKEVADDLGMV